jgi:aminopeptidase YwaD
MKPIFLILLFATQFSFAQSDKKILKDIKKTVYFLADDKLEGRRTGTIGEKRAFAYIIDKFQKNKIDTFPGIGRYLQNFEVSDGLFYADIPELKAGKTYYKLNEDFFPMPYSGNGDFNSSKMFVMYDMGYLISENKNNPHFDAEEALYQKMTEMSSKTDLIILYNSIDTAFSYVFDPKNKKQKLEAGIVFCNNKIISDIQNKSKNETISAHINITTGKRTGHNVVGYINNNAPLTVILGAHYDHLGYGEDHNSLYVGKEKMIHNGADDNASGTAALIALSSILKKSGSKKYNYVFVAFSGEELGLYGSKYFVEHPPIDFKNVNYMVNMDMVGRLNDSTHGITIGGYGTSPTWGQIINTNDDYFKIKVDSAGSGPSDHTSFYRKDLPVLFFFTGTHSDYHKPSDDADKINYEGELKIIRYIQSLIEKTASLDKISFTKTREAAAMGKSSFKVTMGIMPDYTFSDNGVKVDGVSENRPAQKAGVKTGDVIYQLGDFMVSDVETYMQALNKFKKGDTTTVKIKRGTDDIKVEITF